mgnify:CR=1 FL=1
MGSKRECNCCCKKTLNNVRCFTNKQCNWRSCHNCVNKQLQLTRDTADIIYQCPQCRKESIFQYHTRFTKWIKQSRSSLLTITKIQQDFIVTYSQTMTEIQYLATHLYDPTPEIDIDPDSPPPSPATV